jgi:hypothetical protein
MRFERKKYLPKDKLTIDDTTRTISSWLTYDPGKLQTYFLNNPNEFLSDTLKLELKKRLNESKKQDTRRSSNQNNTTT